MLATSRAHDEQEDGPSCWICLGTEGMLSNPCMCPRKVHPSCLARWQLQQAGRKEERSCRFCNASLPDWKQILAPSPSGPAPVDPVMVVSLGGRAVKLRVRPGPEGMAQFRQQVRELFGIPADVEFECSFKCKAPSGDMVQLEGLASYDAATHVASLMATQRAAAAARRANSAPHPRVGTADGSSSGGAALAQQSHPHAQPIEQHQQPQYAYAAGHQHYLHYQQAHLEAAHSAPQPLHYYASTAHTAVAYPAGAPASAYPLAQSHMLFA
ncbi:hypothetical protein HXX76_004049 [Chlamydomonas incerta]|uniref:RING-CH-type domain-containing protein n=1 Tax=Chlamydomonas incerta TaxID=51695 RepID=A0A835W5A8_CHLIN|nr:hypothetical protein HXX76_004049 [Chlamydomonas incerta]|eukprot:KAG2439930.1 hypothetical protein HXX76_004049 [Chlamydomonas incerta]